MRIAVACDGLTIAPHLVQSSSYMCYTVEDGVVVDSRNVPAFDRPPDTLPSFFHAIEAGALMTGRIEDELASMLRASGIRVIAGASGDPLTSVREHIASE